MVNSKHIFLNLLNEYILCKFLPSYDLKVNCIIQFETEVVYQNGFYSFSKRMKKDKRKLFFAVVIH